MYQKIKLHLLKDFCATHLLFEALKGCDVIFHLAYTTLPKTSNDDPDFDVSSNVLGTIRMLDEAVKAKVKKLFSFLQVEQSMEFLQFYQHLKLIQQNQHVLMVLLN